MCGCVHVAVCGAAQAKRRPRARKRVKDGRGRDHTTRAPDTVRTAVDDTSYPPIIAHSVPCADVYSELGGSWWNELSWCAHRTYTHTIPVTICCACIFQYTRWSLTDAHAKTYTAECACINTKCSHGQSHHEKLEYCMHVHRHTDKANTSKLCKCMHVGRTHRVQHCNPYSENSLSVSCTVSVLCVGCAHTAKDGTVTFSTACVVGGTAGSGSGPGCFPPATAHAYATLPVIAAAQ